MYHFKKTLVSLPPKVELFKLKNNITGFAYNDEIKLHAARTGFDFGFVEGSQHAAYCLMDFAKENNLNVEDLKPLLEKMLHRKIETNG